MTIEPVPPTFAMALPDDPTAKAVIDANGKPQMVLPNQLKLPPQTAALLQGPDQISWFPKAADAPRKRAGPVLNLCADFDTYRTGLRSMANWFSPDTVIFNHPTAVAYIANHNLMQKIAVPGLQIAKSTRVLARKPDDFETGFADAQLAYPVRVQSTSARDNASAIVINEKPDWGKVLATDWPGKWFNLVQLKQPDLRQHLRYRVCFIGSQAEITVFPFAYPPATVLREIKMTRKTDTDAVRKICTGLLRHIPLDYWTAEFSSLGADKLRLEHIWAGLPLSEDATRTDASAVLWPKAAARLHALVQDPRKWRNWQNQGLQKTN